MTSTFWTQSWWDIGWSLGITSQTWLGASGSTWAAWGDDAAADAAQRFWIGFRTDEHGRRLKIYASLMRELLTNPRVAGIFHRVPVLNLPILVCSGKCQSGCIVLGCELWPPFIPFGQQKVKLIWNDQLSNRTGETDLEGSLYLFFGAMHLYFEIVNFSSV